METVIRAYLSGDFVAVQAILKDEGMFDEVWDCEENFASMMRKDPSAVLVAMCDNTLVGCLITSSYGSLVSFFYRLTVKKGFREKGIGAQLLNSAESALKKRGVKEIAFYVDAGKEDLKTYYLNRGYHTTGKQFFCMWKRL